MKSFKTFLEEKVFHLVQNPAKILATLALQKMSQLLISCEETVEHNNKEK